MGLISLIPVIGEIVDRVIPDPDKKLELQLELAKLADQEASRESQERIAQVEVNKTEAIHKSIFVAGWRPAVGWIGAAGLGYSFLLEPFMSWIAAVVFDYKGNFPDLNIIDLMILMSGMLGFSYHRSGDKRSGVEDSVVSFTKKNDEVVAVPEKKKKKVLGVEWPF